MSDTTPSIREALVALVRLKDLKQWIESGTAPDEAKAQYDREKEPAWEGARLALEGERGVSEDNKDTERMNWLSVPGRRVEIWHADHVLSFHKERKAVSYYVNGRLTITEGENLRDAIDKAMHGDGRGATEESVA